MDLRRIAVVGTCGMGKSTMARRIGACLDQPYYELDSLYWNPGWEITPEDEFVRRVESVVSQESWVIDGNYSLARPMIWPRATTLIWLNYSFPVAFLRLLLRTIRRGITRAPCCNGNRESLARAFFHRDSILLWAITSHPTYNREYPLEIERHPHLALVKLRRTKDADAFLASLVGRRSDRG